MPLSVSEEDRTEPGLVLIFDADPLLTEMLEYHLGRRGYRAAAAHDGGLALSLLEEAPPVAVITETMLPVCDGYEVLRRIRADERFAALPVIILSARRQDRDIVEAFELGASDYVTKPFILEELMARLARLLKDRKR